MDAVKIEMWNRGTNFEEHEVSVSNSIRYADINCYVVFDIELGENFRQKAISCEDGHKTEAPSKMTYNTIVYQD